jgi:uncharacterized membrane protein YdfJ with MMPL/SSD domain
VAEDESAARIRIIPDTGPRTQRTSDLVSRLRTEMKPLAASGGSCVAVTGLTAVSAASRRLGWSLPVVSKRLSALESRLDVRLVQSGAHAGWY